MGKDSQYVRIWDTERNFLKFGTAMRMGDSREYSYYCLIREYGKRQVILTKVLKITKFILTFLKNNANINI